MGEILIPRRTKVERAYELLADITVGTATTNVDITGLNIGKGDEVVLVSEFNNTSGSGSCLYILDSSNPTITNYYTQILEASNTSVTPSKANFPRISYAYAGTRSINISKIKLTNSGYFVSQNDSNLYNGSGIVLGEQYATSTFVLSFITSIKIQSSVTNAIGIGSRFQLYKIGGA